MDKIFLHGMRAETLIGVYGWEREHLQPLIIDWISASLKSGGGRRYRQYGTLCRSVRNIAPTAERTGLSALEALAEYIADWVLGCFGAVWVRVKIVKPGILPGVREVGVEIERDKDKD